MYTCGNLPLPTDVEQMVSPADEAGSTLVSTALSPCYLIDMQTESSHQRLKTVSKLFSSNHLPALVG
jgi:hypothetical protein